VPDRVVVATAAWLVEDAMPTVEAEWTAVEFWNAGEMLLLLLATARLVGREQVSQATLLLTVTGMTAVHGQSVIVTVVGSVMTEVRVPWMRTVGLGQ